MLHGTHSRILALLLCSASTQLLAQDEILLCETLENAALPDVIQINATVIPAGVFNLPQGGGGAPAPGSTETGGFCRVELTVAPAVGIEVWLPLAQNWNGKYLAVGGGGLAGSISYGAMLPAIAGNYVTSSTDTGHKSPDLAWLGDPVKLRDFGYRAIHEMTLKTKALVSLYYNRQPDYSYFNGCSTGGRQALMEAQRYPDDFDGIVAGAPANHYVAAQIAKFWINNAAKPVDATLLPRATLELVTRTVMEQCDALDGIADGLLENPRACNFAPASLQCAADEQTTECLSAEQVNALEQIYQGPVNSAGERLFYGYVPGGEAPVGYPNTWLMANGSGLADPIPLAWFSRAVLGDPEWNDWRSFDYDADFALATNRNGNIMDATDPNLDAFQNNGGKLLMYHGWNDPQIVPEGSIAYYENVIANTAMSSPADAALLTADYARLFMVPGMAHCGGGPGTDVFDKQAVIETWVEQGQAPDMIPAAHREADSSAPGGIRNTMTRPLCPYPLVARYDGSGDSNDISNFSCMQTGN
jgi:feruloyl esterase